MATRKTAAPRTRSRRKRIVTHRDSLDFRDRIYEPSLAALPAEMWPDKGWMRVRDQLIDGSCTGFGLAAVIDYLNVEAGVREPVSARMLYEMARHHDQWPGERYEGSSARGAMKGWHKNGVCPDRLWRFDPNTAGHLTTERQQAALRFPLGAYYRVMRRRSDVHAALQEVHAVFVSAGTHKGWDEPEDGRIPFDPRWPADAGHAFAILGYTEDGFLIQNSWGRDWAGMRRGRTRYPGLALWSYEDFEKNLWDAWVARTALPVRTLAALSSGWIEDTEQGAKAVQKAPPRHEIRDYYVHVDDGAFDPFGDFPSQADEVAEIVARAVRSGAKHLMLYAHGGLNDVKQAAARVGAWREPLEKNGVRQLHFIWETGLLPELRDVILGKEDLARERAGGLGEWWDRIVERVTAKLGHALWKEMITDAELAFEPARAGTATLELLQRELAALPAAKRPAVHLVGHSAGSIWFAHLLRRWQLLGMEPIASLILFAPACTVKLYGEVFRPALAARAIERMALFLLDDRSEREDSVALIYRKSLLYLVSRAYQKRDAVVPLLGMQSFQDLVDTEGLGNRFRRFDPLGHPEWTRAKTHGGFDNDLTTMNRALELVLGAPPSRPFRAEDLSTY